MKTYCINNNCPFTSCKKHLKHCRAKKRKIKIANYDGVCRRYISWLVDTMTIKVLSGGMTYEEF